jgi:glycosyltransferase involved in cell wall biosynthesis
VNSQLASVILPVYCQADHLETVVREYENALAKLPCAHELLLIVNGSGDNSLAICRALAGELKDVRVHESPVAGWGAAVKMGLREAKGDLLCYTNLARTSARDLLLLLLYAFANPDTVVKANRKIRDSAYRRVGSLLYNIECRTLFDLSYWDINGTPKVFPRAFGGLLGLTRDDDLIDLEFNVICRQHDYKVLEVPVFSARRHGGRTTTNIRSAWRMYLGALGLRRSNGFGPE